VAQFNKPHRWRWEHGRACSHLLQRRGSLKVPTRTFCFAIPTIFPLHLHLPASGKVRLTRHARFNSVGRGSFVWNGVTRRGECIFVACAAFSPLAAIVLSIAESHEIGSEQQLDQFVVFVHLCIKSSDFRLLCTFGGAFGLAFFAFESVLLCSQSAGFSAADVFADHFSVEAFGPRVVAAAFIPAHFCYTSDSRCV